MSNFSSNSLGVFWLGVADARPKCGYNSWGVLETNLCARKRCWLCSSASSATGGSLSLMSGHSNRCRIRFVCQHETVSFNNSVPAQVLAFPLSNFQQNSLSVFQLLSEVCLIVETNLPLQKLLCWCKTWFSRCARPNLLCFSNGKCKRNAVNEPRHKSAESN